MKSTIKDVLLFIGVITIICLLVFKCDKQTIQVTKIVEVEKLTKGKTDTITIYKDRIVQKTKDHKGNSRVS